jgi:putative ABC transport system substrate-binding protein
VAAFRTGLRQYGYVEGVNIAVEYRFADGKAERLPLLRDELLTSPVDVLVLGDAQSITVLQQATATTPIVMTTSSDLPTSIAESMGHPGGIFTGLTTSDVALTGKRLELLLEMAPGASRVAVIWNKQGGAAEWQWEALRKAADTKRVELLSTGINSPSQLDDVFEDVRARGADAILVLPNAVINSQSGSIAELAAGLRLPSMAGNREFVTAGGLMGYGPNRPAMFERAAFYVDRILKGAYPGDLPIEGPMRFDLVINLRTAQSIGVTVPRSILLDATEAVQ